MLNTPSLSTCLANVHALRVELRLAQRKVDDLIGKCHATKIKPAMDKCDRVQTELNRWQFLAMNHPDMRDPLFTEWFGFDRAIPYPVSC